MHNFYSDTQTVPSRTMREAILDAAVGDEQSDADPTTNQLCERVAKLLGKERAVFLPSGTMCNEIAIHLHCQPGDEVICARHSHIVGFEGGGPAALSGVMMHPLDGTDGTFSAEQVRNAIRPESRYFPRSKLVSVEQTLNMAGGRVWPLDSLRAIADIAKNAGLATHMDGARLLNAAVASGVPAAEHAAGYDSVWIDFTKGLGCPIGAVLAGTDTFVAEAWRIKQRWGGAMRQSGIAAAMCLYALDQNVERLADDHTLAAELANRISDIPGVQNVITPDTNIVIFDLAPNVPTAEDLGARTLAAGVRICPIGERRVRIVTHHDVNAASGDALLAALAKALG